MKWSFPFHIRDANVWVLMINHSNKYIAGHYSKVVLNFFKISRTAWPQLQTFTSLLMQFQNFDTLRLDSGKKKMFNKLISPFIQYICSRQHVPVWLTSSHVPYCHRKLPSGVQSSVKKKFRIQQIYKMSETLKFFLYMYMYF